MSLIDEFNLKTNKKTDLNGWMEIEGNPISKVGVFPYMGAQINSNLEPDKIYYVYRPAEELSNPETLESFKLVPWTDEHEMLGSADDGFTPAEKKGVHGIVGEKVFFEDGYLKANLKIFSDKLAKLIDDGKKELSIGYRCIYDIESGVFNGQRYDAIQRNIRGNHLATVEEGRSGKDVAVLDHFKFTFDEMRIKMNEKTESKPDEAKDEGVTTEAFQALVDQVKSLSEAISKITEAKKEVSDEDEDEDEDKDKKSEDEDTDSDKDKEVKDEEEKKSDKDKDEKAMDAKIKAALDSFKRDQVKTIEKEISARNDLANRLSPLIGGFDAKDKTYSEVIAYGVKKLGLDCKKGHEESALNAYLFGLKQSDESFVLDTNESNRDEDSYFDKHMNGEI
jgi:hypothetical protein